MIGDTYHGLVGFHKRASIKDGDIYDVNEEMSALRNRSLSRLSRNADSVIVWERKSNGYRIVDLRLDRFMQALRFILTYSTQTDPICKAVGLYDDVVSIRTYSNVILQKMDDMLSLCALQEGTGDLVGVIVASTVSQKLRRVIRIQGDALVQVTSLKNHAIAKAMLYEKLTEVNTVHLDVLCVKSDYQRSGIGTSLLRSCVARISEFASTCVGEFTSGASQTIAKRLGFEVLFESPYRHIGSEGSRFQIFESCYPENYSIACMMLTIPPPTYTEPITPASEPSKKSLKRRKGSNKKYKTR